MKLLVDMKLSPRWVDSLADAGILAAHWSQVGSHKATDLEIATYARDGEYIIVTHDLEIGAILAITGSRKPSVVLIRAEDVSPASIGDRVAKILIQMESDLQKGAILTIDPSRTRVRILPLRTVE